MTGGANGLGKGFAVALASGGCVVMIADIDEEGLGKTADQITASGGRCLFKKTNMFNKNDISAVVNYAVQEFERIDILINCAGGSADVANAPIENIREEDWDKVVNLNVTLGDG